MKPIVMNQTNFYPKSPFCISKLIDWKGNKSFVLEGQKSNISVIVSVQCEYC